jgi:hypothetical protein
VKVRSHQVAVLTLIKCLQEEAYTHAELCEETGMVSSTVREWVALAMRMKLVHICGWDRTVKTRNPCIPIYIWGAGRSAPRPKKQTPAERQARCRQKRRTLALTSLDSTMPMCGQAAQS